MAMRGSREIFEEIQKQIAENKKKNEEYFQRMGATVKASKDTINDIELLMRRDKEVWKQCGIDLENYDGNNPFLLLERIAPEVFPNMSEWKERAHQDALKEAEFYGFGINRINDAKKARKSRSMQLKASGVSKEDIEKSRSKKVVRKVRV